ncbi:MAG: hypothetical protein FWF30_01510 [Coriobacteriia bacterium]|nr:hypothetical protein [Coriobacteriia bacterium]
MLTANARANLAKRALIVLLSFALISTTLFFGVTRAAFGDTHYVPIQVHNGAGYTLKFYFDVPDGVTVPASRDLDPTHTNYIENGLYVVELDCDSKATGSTDSVDTLLDSALAKADSLNLHYVEIYRNSDDTLVATVSANAIAHRSNHNTIIGDDGTMGNAKSNGTRDVNPGNANFWFSLLSADTSATLQGTKTIDGASQAGNAGLFDFSVTDAEGTVVSTGSNDRAGNITFAPIKYTQADIGTHTYTVKELGDRVPASEASRWDKDASEFTVTVTVAFVDNTLTATVDYPNGPLQFTNTFNAAASVNLQASKTAVGRALSDGQFSFEAIDTNTDAVVATGTNDADGNIVFSSIGYDQTDAGQTYTYIIKEVGTPQAGWTLDGSEYRAQVTVNEDGNTITPEVAYSTADEQPPAFVNTYHATGSVVLEAKKTVTGADLVAGQFNFTVKDASGQVVSQGTNDAVGKVSFSAIKFDDTQLGTYHYTMQETSTDATGWTYDKSVHNVTVTVSDGSTGGTLAISALYDNSATPPVFTNSYVEPKTYPASLELVGKKIVQGTDEDVSGFFDFSVTDEDGNVVASGTNASDGTIAFSEIDYTGEADLGTHVYTVQEDNVDSNNWTVDKSVYTVTVSVQSNALANQGDQQMVATVESIAKAGQAVDAITFTNVYSVDNVQPGKRPQPTTPTTTPVTTPATTPATGDDAWLLLLGAAGLLAVGGGALAMRWVRRSRRKPDQA